MQTKFCVECSNENVMTAKYCCICGFSFASLGALNPTSDKNINKSNNKKNNLNKNKKQTLIFDTNQSEDVLNKDENEEDGDVSNTHSIEIDDDFKNDFANLIISQGETKSKPKGMKFEEIVGSSEQDSRSIGKRESKDPKDADSILQSTKNTRNTRK